MRARTGDVLTKMMRSDGSLGLDGGSQAALDRLAARSRTPLGVAPTPLLPAHRLRAALGPDAPEIFLKLEDQTAFALGGNKVRKLAFELAPDRLEGVTCLVTAGGPQSNHCRVTAAAASHLGLACVLVLNGPEPERPGGNAMLHRMFGARIHTVDRREDRDPAMVEVGREIEAAGGRALIVPIGASTGRGALGYVAVYVELAHQIAHLPPCEGNTWVFVSASSCGTLAGLLLGRSLLQDGARLVGVSADVSAFDMRSTTLRLASEAAGLLEWDGAVQDAALAAADEYVGAGYARPTAAGQEAITLFAHTEGVVLDPVYTGKAAAGMVDWIRRGSLSATDRVVFIHTGGHPALFA